MAVSAREQTLVTANYHPNRFAPPFRTIRDVAAKKVSKIAPITRASLPDKAFGPYSGAEEFQAYLPVPRATVITKTVHVSVTARLALRLRYRYRLSKRQF